MTGAKGTVVALVVLAAAALTGCAQPETAATQLRAALEATETEPLRFDYVDASLDAAFRVTGVVEDDFRYAATLRLGDVRAYREVVDDDAITVRVLNRKALSVLGTPGAAPAGRGSRLLLAGRWVKDPTGAPPLGATADLKPGDDPIHDALHALRYVETVLGETGALVTEFNADAPEYIEEDDPFPHPQKGVTRFDIAPTPLPRRQDVTVTGDRQPPELRHFRRLAVYVRAGRVVRVVEKVDIASFLDDLEERYDFAAPAGKPILEQVRTVTAQINRLRTELGQDPLRVRSMSMTLTEVGEPQSIPRLRGVTVAALATLQGRGRGAAGPGDDAAETTQANPNEVRAPQVAPPGPAASEPRPAATPGASEQPTPQHAPAG